MVDLTNERLEAVAKHGLPAGIAERLRGNTAAELEADARAIAEMFGRAEEGSASEAELILAQRELKRARARRLLGDGDTWKAAGDE